MDVIVETDRDRRTLDWLISQVGELAVEQACAQLTGARKPYVSNIAKVLGLTPPENLEQTSRSDARLKLVAIKGMLKSKSC